MEINDIILREDGFYEYIGRGFAKAETGDIFIDERDGRIYEITIDEYHKPWGVPHPITFYKGDGERNSYMRECDINYVYRKIKNDNTRYVTGLGKITVTDNKTKELSIDNEGKELFLELYKSSLVINLIDLYTLDEACINLNKEEVIKLKTFLDDVLKELK